MIHFNITDEEELRVNTWLKDTVYPKAIKRQKAKITKKHPLYKTFQNNWAEGFPYEGARDGGLSYCFRSTGIGMVFKAKYRCAGQRFELDLTDYNSW